MTQAQNSQPQNGWAHLIGATVQNTHGVRFTVTGLQWHPQGSICAVVRGARPWGYEVGEPPACENMVPIQSFLNLFFLVDEA